MKNRRIAIKTAACLLADLSPWPLVQAAAPKEFYPQVKPRRLVFPRDHGAHADYRTEWWYLTGWLGEGPSALGFN